MRVRLTNLPSVNKKLVLCLSALLLLGLVVMYSASYPLGVKRFDDGNFYLRRQLLYLFVGLFSMWVTSKLPYRTWEHLGIPMVILSTLLLVLLFIPGLGVTAGGARRWISLGAVRFQPSEFAKLALVIYLASSIARKQGRMDSFAVGIVPHLIIPSLLLGLTLIQPDFGTFMTLMSFIVIMLFIGGARPVHLVGLFLSSLPFLYYLVAGSHYRRERFLAFLHPWENIRDSGFQIIQSHVALHVGGLTGVGLGEGRQKLFYLPDVHTDFIFSVIGEEMGFVGVLLVVMLYGLFTVLGFSVAVRAARSGAKFACYLATGLTLLISVPAFTNMAVAVGILPTKGMVLPFLSYGGSALVIVLTGCGILLNLSRCYWQEDLV